MITSQTGPISGVSVLSYENYQEKLFLLNATIMNTVRKRKTRNHANVAMSAVNLHESGHISILVFQMTAFQEISPSKPCISYFSNLE
jgi:hypothetical protein